MNTDAPDITGNKEREAFIQERLNAEFVRWLKWAMLAGSIAFLALAALDVVVYPAHAPRFFVYRVAVAACLALMALIVGATRNYRAHFLLGLCAIGFSAATIEAMILQTGGHASHYATGMILLAVSALTFLPVGLSFHAIASAIIYGVYLLRILVTERIDDAEMFFTNNFFMCSIILTVLVFRYLSMQTTRKQLDAEYELFVGLEKTVEERTKGLEAAVAELTNEIDRRKDAEATLERSRMLLHGVFNGIQDGIVVLDLDLNILMSNSMVESTFNNGSPVGFKKMRCFELYRNEQRKCDNCLAFRAIESKTVQVGIIAYEQHEGDERWLEVFSFPFVDSQGRTMGVIQHLRDITDRKEADEALRESEERFKMLLDDVPVAISMINGDGTVEYVNRKHAELLGYELQDIPALEDWWAQAYPVETDRTRIRAAWQELTRRAYQGEKISPVDRNVVCKDGTLRNLELRITSAAEKIIVVFSDITERKRIEQELKVREARLIQANKMASLGLLVSSVSHEVNNPNNFIMFNSSLLKDAWKDIEPILDRHASEAGPIRIAALPYEEMKYAIPKLLSGISDGAGRIKGIVERLRKFACEGRSCLDGSIDINASVRSSVMILQNQIAKHTDNFILKLSDTLPVVRGSSQQIEQVIINLIMNALQALRSRKDFVMVTTLHHNDSSRVIIEVQDSGKGIPDNVLERLTEPFFTTRLDAGGTGLGLSISDSLVRDHNGALVFRSEEGKGTTVRIMLPEMENRDAGQDGVTEGIPGDCR